MDLTMDKDYFEKLLDAKFNHVHAEIMSLKEDTQSILHQTTKTNGRVTELEKWKAQKEGFNQGIDSSENKFTASRTFWIAILTAALGALVTYLWH